MELSSIPALASGTFTGGPKDEVAATDIYKLTSAQPGGTVKPITSIQELSAAIDQSVLDLTLDAGIASDFMSKTKEGVEFNKDQLSNRLLAASSEFKSAFGELTNAMKKGAMLQTHMDKAKDLMCTVNDVRSAVSSSKIGDVHALGKFVNKYSGTKIFSTQDKGALSGILSSAITTASDLGIPGAFKAITDTVTDNGILGRVTRAVLPFAMRNGDFKMLKDIAGGPAGSLVNVFAPGFTQDFAKAFTYKGDRGKTLDSFEDIFGAFNNLDNMWDVLEQGDGGTALNLLALMGGSRDFQNLMMTGVRYWTTEMANGRKAPVRVDPMYALAASYPETTVGQALQRDFPKVALLNLYNARLPRSNGRSAGLRNGNNSNFLDPRMVNGAIGALLGF